MFRIAFMVILAVLVILLAYWMLRKPSPASNLSAVGKAIERVRRGSPRREHDPCNSYLTPRG